MTAPQPWVPGENVNAGKMYDRVTSPLNALQAAPVAPTPVALGLASSVLASTPTPGVTRDGFQISVEGLIAPNGSWTAGQNLTAAVTIPSGYRPAVQQVRLAVGNAVGATARLVAKTDGTVDIQIGATAPTTIDLSILSGYRLAA